MSTLSIGLDETLQNYLLDSVFEEHPLLRELREETAKLPQRNLQIAPEQGRFMAFLARLIDARRYLEIGTFTGYSSLAVTMAMPPEGRTVACDISAEWTDIAQRYWRRAGVDERIRLELRPALETLETLLASGAEESFDLAFIDADKESYIDYFERCHELVRPGGLIMLDNTLWSGRVVDATDTSAGTEAIRSFNRYLYRRERVDVSLVPIGDGLTLVRKR